MEINKFGVNDNNIFVVVAKQHNNFDVLSIWLLGTFWLD